MSLTHARVSMSPVPDLIKIGKHLLRRMLIFFAFQGEGGIKHIARRLAYIWKRSLADYRETPDDAQTVTGLPF